MSSSNDDADIIQDSCNQWSRTIFNMGDFYTENSKLTLIYNLSSEDLQIDVKSSSKSINVGKNQFMELEMASRVYSISNPVYYIYYIQPEFVYIICIDNNINAQYCKKIQRILFKHFVIKEWPFNEITISDRKFNDKFIYDFFKSHKNSLSNKPKDESKESTESVEEKQIQKILNVGTTENSEQFHIIIFIEPEQNISAQFLNNLRTFTEHNKNIKIICPDNSPPSISLEHKKRVIKYSSVLQTQERQSREYSHFTEQKNAESFPNINTFKFFILKTNTKNRLLISSHIVKTFKCIKKIDFLHHDLILFSKSNLNPNFIGDIEILGFDYLKNKKIFDHIEATLKFGADIKMGLLTLSKKHKEELKKMNICLLPKHSFQPQHTHPVLNTPLSYTCKK